MSEASSHTIYGIGPDGGVVLAVAPDGTWSSAYENFKEVAGIINALRADRDNWKRNSENAAPIIDSLKSEIEAVYALGRIPIEQSRQIKPLDQFVKTRFVHVEEYNALAAEIGRIKGAILILAKENKALRKAVDV